MERKLEFNYPIAKEAEQPEPSGLTEKEVFKKLHIVLQRSDTAKEVADAFEKIVSACPKIGFCKSYASLVKRQKLTPFDRAVLLDFTDWFIRNGTEPKMGTDDEWSDSEDYYKSADTLVSIGLLRLVPKAPEYECNDDRKRYSLSVRACRLLLCGVENLVNYGAISRQGDVIPCSEIRKKELFFDPRERSIAGELAEVLDEKNFVKVSKRLESKGLRGGVSILLHGAPGTGKTELCKQLARESGRNILLVSPAKLMGSYVGESEKNFTALFDNFNFLCALSKRPPILLFNEADAFMSRRLGVRSSIDKSENTIQSIILQGMENLSGIFIATTNLKDNIDDAYDRRFTYKAEFNAPSPRVLAKIWLSRLPELGEEGAGELAAEFPFSGGHIENVLIRCELRYALKGAYPSLEEIKEFCRCEAVGEAGSGRFQFKGFEKY